MDADIIISLPKFKTHGLTVITGAIKNSYGFLPGAQKARLHKIAGSPKRFHEMLVDVFQLRVPDLFIVDAVVGMEGNGPASPDLRDIGLILGLRQCRSTGCGYCHSSWDVNRVCCGSFRRQRKRGLGDYDLKHIEILGELKPLHNFKIPPLGGGSHHAQ